jgi:flagellar protein FlgJ
MNTPGPLSSSALVSDTRGIDALRSTAARDPKAAVNEAAKQFEALFMQELLKSMRQATLSSGMLENSGSQMGTEMLDTQLATKMTGLPGGLSEMIAKQLSRQMGGAAVPQVLGAIPLAPIAKVAAASAAAVSSIKASVAGSRQADFVREHSQAARAAEAETGIPSGFMVAQAAHESGWGRREIKNADGSTSFNVFGIKAGGSWKGPVAEVTTTEYINGVARKVTAKFRAYASYEESFRDYARMMKNSPRYSQVVANASTAEGFAQGLQRAGYATDPAYADKLTRVINTTLRLQRVVT